jgi:hypothetical protein
MDPLSKNSLNMKAVYDMMIKESIKICDDFPNISLSV